MTAMSPGAQPRQQRSSVGLPTRAIARDAGRSQGALPREPSTSVHVTLPRVSPRTLPCRGQDSALAGAATSSSSRAWASAGVGLRQPGQHPGQLRSRARVVEHGQPGAGHRAVAGLLDQDVPVGVRRHLRQVGHHQHLGGAGQLGQPPARPRPPRLPPTPASTSSKTNVGTGLVPASATSRASITRDSSPPEAPLCSGRGSEPVLAASRNSTSSTPLAVCRSQRLPTRSGLPLGGGSPGGGSASCWVTVISSRASRHGQQRQLGGDLAGEPRRRLAAGARQASARPRRARRAATAARPAAPRSARRCRRGRAAGPPRSRPRRAPRRRSRRTCGSARSAPPAARTRRPAGPGRCRRRRRRRRRRRPRRRAGR